MSLLINSMTNAVKVNISSQRDGYGGTKQVWQDGEVFLASFVKDSSNEIESADLKRSRSTYTIITNRDISLNFHEIVKRVSDSKLFRITSNGLDNCTPDTANLNMRVVTAEEYVEG